MSLLRVAKEEVPAKLYLTDGDTLFAALYLAPFSQLRSGPQTIADLMSEAGCALPVKTHDGAFLLVGKRCVAAVAVPSTMRIPEGFWTNVAVRVRLAGRHRIEGRLLVEEGTGTRMSDFLNASPSWFTIESSDELVWVAKDHLVALEAEDT